MLGPHWLLRMMHWVRNPLPARKAAVILIIVAVCLAVVALETLGWLPDWAAADRPGRFIRPQGF